MWNNSWIAPEYPASRAYKFSTSKQREEGKEEGLVTINFMDEDTDAWVTSAEECEYHYIYPCPVQVI